MADSLHDSTAGSPNGTSGQLCSIFREFARPWTCNYYSDMYHIEVVQRPLQALFLIAPPDLAHSFGSQSDVGRHFGHSLTVMQLGEGESAKNHPNGLNTTSKQQVHSVPVMLGQPDVESMGGSHDQV